jgi:hypothetical protein
MRFTPRKINLFLLLKLPSAYFSGVRIVSVSENEVIARVRYKWINQNPFKSLYWATQGMASELTTGMLVMRQLSKRKEKISMLVVNQKGNFSKKAKGKILFKCNEIDKIEKAINATIETGEGQNIVLTSQGIDESGDVVSSFEYEWSIKLKSI